MLQQPHSALPLACLQRHSMWNLLLLLRWMSLLLLKAALLRPPLRMCSAVHRGNAGKFLEALHVCGWRQQVIMAPWCSS